MMMMTMYTQEPDYGRRLRGSQLRFGCYTDRCSAPYNAPTLYDGSVPSVCHTERRSVGRSLSEGEGGAIDPSGRRTPRAEARECHVEETRSSPVKGKRRKLLRPSSEEEEGRPAGRRWESLQSP